MKRLEGARPGLTCGSCRRFDGLAWCNRWNIHTDAGSPICDQYRPRREKPLGDVPVAQEEPGRRQEGEDVGGQDH